MGVIRWQLFSRWPALFSILRRVWSPNLPKLVRNPAQPRLTSWALPHPPPGNKDKPLTQIGSLACSALPSSKRSLQTWSLWNGIWTRRMGGGPRWFTFVGYSKLYLVLFAMALFIYVCKKCSVSEWNVTAKEKYLYAWLCMAQCNWNMFYHVLTKVQQHWDYECEEHRVCRFEGCACYGFYTIWWWHGPNFSHEPARGHPLLSWLSSSTWRWHGREAIGGLCSQPSNLCLEDQPFPKVDLPCSVFSRVAGDQTTVGNKEGTGVCVGNPPGLTHPEHGSEEETEPTKAWLIMKYI